MNNTEQQTYPKGFFPVHISICVNTYPKESTADDATCHKIDIKLLVDRFILLAKEKYDLEKLEEEKREKYNPDSIFKNKKEETFVENTNLPVEIKKETFFKKLISFIKGLFNKTN
jgi:hypothetical protein